MWVKTALLLTASTVFGQLSLGNKGYYGKGSKDVSRRLRNLCPCSENALKDIQGALDRYTYSVLPKSGPNVEALIEEIKDVAYNCTKRVECKCPEGYFKTIDGLECLRISREPVDCMDAEKVCGNDFNSRLAIAKDPKRLQRLSDIIRQTGHHQDLFWIGLSYNRTNIGGATWKWADGTKISAEMKKKLSLKDPDVSPDELKKSLRMLEIGGIDGPVERVAINGRYEGHTWAQESCKSESYGPRPKHRYICEFLMFKVNIKSRD
jgi:hypothetical protein